MARPHVNSLDHLVLTVTDINASLSFYEDVLGMEAVEFTPSDGVPRWALSFGFQKINLHPADGPFEPKATTPTPGSADLCFLTDTPVDDWVWHMAQHRVPVELGPVHRTGAITPIVSIFVRDPDKNLIEISNRLRS